MKLSFIIVNYKSLDYLNICLESIFKKVFNIDFEIIIVNNDDKKINALNKWDNNCVESLNPEDCLKRKTHANKKITIIENNKNVGFGKANNLGVLISSGEIICFLNPDTEIESSNVASILKKFETDKNIGIIGPQILEKNKDNKNSTQPWSVGVELTIVEIIKGKIGFSESKKIWNSKKETRADWVTGACLFVEKRIFLQINGFDEKFFLYYEDLDLCKRIKLAKKEVIFYPEFKVLHRGGKSSINILKQKEEYFKSQDYYYAKWFSRKTVLLLKFLRKFYIWKYKI